MLWCLVAAGLHFSGGWIEFTPDCHFVTRLECLTAQQQLRSSTLRGHVKPFKDVWSKCIPRGGNGQPT